MARWRGPLLGAGLTGLSIVCVASFWIPARTYGDSRTLREQLDIGYAAGLRDKAVTADDVEVSFRRTSSDEFRVDLRLGVENDTSKTVDTTCYYLVPPESKLIDTGKLDDVQVDDDGSFTITGDDLDRNDVPFFPTQGVTLANKFDDAGYWVYEQPCSVDAGTTSDHGARFSVPSSVVYQSAFRTQELEFSIDGIGAFFYSTDDQDALDLFRGLRFSDRATYSVDGNGWTVNARPPAGHRVVVAKPSEVKVEMSNSSDESDLEGHPSFTVGTSATPLPLTLLQIVSTLLLGIVVDRAFEAWLKSDTTARAARTKTDDRRRSHRPPQKPKRH